MKTILSVTDLSVIEVSKREQWSNWSVWAVETRESVNQRTQVKSVHRPARISLNIEHILITYESAGEDLIIGGSQFSPQIVCGDSTSSSSFLFVVHLFMKRDIHSQDYRESPQPNLMISCADAAGQLRKSCKLTWWTPHIPSLKIKAGW